VGTRAAFAVTLADAWHARIPAAQGRRPLQRQSGLSSIATRSSRPDHRAAGRGKSFPAGTWVVASLRRDEVRRSCGRHAPPRLTHGSSQLFPRASPGPTSALDAQTSLPSRLLFRRETARHARADVIGACRQADPGQQRRHYRGSTSVRRYRIHRPISPARPAHSRFVKIRHFGLTSSATSTPSYNAARTLLAAVARRFFECRHRRSQ